MVLLIQKALEDREKHISLKRVQRYMSSIGLYSIVVKKFRTHSSKPNVEEKENTINRDFKATNINEKWCTDITYIYTIKDGWTYLASVMDLYKQKDYRVYIWYLYDDGISNQGGRKCLP
ncbi:hypothetical protein [Thermoanaerobacterium thermosaccharolyticum]|uniref:hypothetical protein n=1 Tax=Thermoanaerobacterium thermosaccharolyticum TaxID=1517 RepID=UPI0018C8C5DB|nr:hypothetical protein [Thermoanaerobacterium thermosaccharolyticum]